MPRTLVKAQFELDDLGPYEGVHDPGIRWNGWACPSFTEEVARKIAADMQAEYDAPREGLTEFDRIVIKDSPTRFLLTAEDGEVYDTIEADADGLFGIGAFYWVWTVAE